MNRPITTLFMLMSVDGKISTGSTDALDVDQDFPHIEGVKEGLHQYYEIEQTTDLWSFNTGRVQQKMGCNEKEMPAKKADGSDGEGNMSLLAKTPFKIAYRSRNEIMVYCIERIVGNIVPLPQALDEALSMKVLSAAIVDGLSKLDGYDADKCVVCKDKLADMVEQAQYGYTSFWMR